MNSNSYADEEIIFKRDLKVCSQESDLIIMSEKMILTVALVALAFFGAELFFVLRDRARARRRSQDRFVASDGYQHMSIHPSLETDNRRERRSEVPEAWLNMPRHLEEDED